MRKITQKWAFMLMTLLCCIAMPQVVMAQNCVEIGTLDGTTNTYYLPINCYYHSSYGQQLYLADEIDHNAANIESISFQYTLATSTKRTISIYMANTDAENLSSAYVTEDLVEVLSATEVEFDNSDDWFTIELETPFAYDGSSNLVVAVFMDYAASETGYNSTARFKYTSATNMARYTTNDYTTAGSLTVTDGVLTANSNTYTGISGTVTAYRPNIQLCFGAGGGGPTCEKPAGIVPSDTTAHEITLTWSDGSGAYNLEYKAKDDTVWTVVLTQSALLSTTLTGLEPNTDYQARVQSYCSALDTISGWRSCSFKTVCASIASFPWLEDFESYAGSTTPDCWDISESTSSSATGTSFYYIWGVVSGTSNKMMRLYNSLASKGTARSTMPTIEMPLSGSYELSFDYVHAANCGPFKVLAKEVGAAAWDTIGTYAMTTTSASTTTPSALPNEAIISLDNYVGQTIQLQFYADANYGSGAIFVDNIAIYDASCVKPTELEAGTITTNSVQLAWDADPLQTAWQLEYKKSADKAWTSVQVTTNPYTLTGLDVYTAYDFRVAAICGENISKYSNTVSAKTVAKVPFAEAFKSLPSDWKRYKVALDSVWAGVDTLANHPVTAGWTVTSGQGVYGTTNHLKLQVYGTDVRNWIVSPYIEMDDNMQLSFDLALTKNSGTLVPAEAGQQDDDKFYVLITTDEGATWEELYVRDNTTSADSYDNINCSADGQNVKIDMTAYATDKIALAFYGESTVTGGNNYLHIRNLVIDTIPSCTKPEGLAVTALSDTLATFTWDEAEGATWAYGIALDTAATAYVPTDADFVGSTTGYTVTIDTLQDNTDYIFFLRQDCGGSHSDYVARQFTTLPAPIQVPWSENFESMTNNTVPEFWDNSASTTSTTTKYYIWGVFTASGNKMLRMYNALVQSGTALINTPRIVLPADEAYELTFDYSHRANCEAFVVKISTDDGISWTNLQSFDVTNTSTNSTVPGDFVQGLINLGDYAGNTVMLQFFVTSNYGSGAIFVDNLDIHVAPDCLKPLQLAVVDSLTTTTTVQLDWQPQGAEQNWLVQYKKAADTTWVYVADSVKAHPYVLTGLQPATVYDIRVAGWCDPTDSLSASEFTSAVKATTACASIAEFPYNENFEGVEGKTSGNVLPICWSYINTVTGSTSYDYYPMVYAGSSYAKSGTNSLKFLSYYNYEGEVYGILPEMEGLSALRMKFNARAYSTSTSSTYYDATFMVGVMSDPADAATFVVIDTIRPASTTYAPFEVKFNNYTGAGKYIAIKMVSPDYVDYDYNGFYMDDIIVDSIPDCYEPVAVKVLSTTATGVKFTFTPAEENSDSLSYAIVVKGAQSAIFTGITADTMTVDGLTAGTEYELYLRSECTNSHSVAISTSFMTKLLPIDLGNGFSDDFEGALQWQLDNGDLENAWVHGTAAHNGEGSKALYISNDGGASNAYTISKPATVFAMKPFNIASGSYVFQYDWRANGESNYDLLRVALVPDSIELVAMSTMLPELGTSGNALAAALPAGWIAFDGGSKLNLDTAWTTFQSEEIDVKAGAYNVVFLWRNDGSGGSQKPAAVDNFSIAKVLCGKPGKPTIDKANITATTAEIVWAAQDGQTAWQIAMDTLKNFNPDSVAPIAVTKDTFLAEGLLPEHTYYIYVRTNCGEDGFSAWSEGASFKSAKLCQKPDGLEITAITDSSVVVTWNTYGQTDFRLTYGIGNAYADSVDVVGGTYTITGLTENTSYKVKVASACDLTVWSTAKTFKTACSPVAAVEENFDGITGVTSGHAMVDCWDYLNLGTNTTYNYYPTVYKGASYAASGENSLKFYSYYSSSASTTTEDQYAILPAINNISGLRIKLKARKYSASYDGSFTIGVMTDPADTATFVVIDSLSTSSVAYEPFKVMLDSYTGEGKYIAIKMDKPVPEGTATYAYRGVHIDDVIVEEIPSCLEPEKLAVDSITLTSARLAWTANNNESAWLVQYKASEDSVWNDVNANANPFILENLTKATSYDVRVAAMCSATDTSAFTMDVTFKTAYGIPFEENFDSYTSLPTDEWSRYSGLLNKVLADSADLAPATVGWTFNSSTTGIFASKHIYCNIYGTSRNHWFVSPVIEASGNIQLTFDMALSKSSTSYTAITKGNQPDDKFAVLVTTDNGESWSVLRQWTNDSTAQYVYDDIPLNEAEYAINLSGFNGPIRLAFYGESTVSNGDNYLHIDNLLIDTIPACPKSTGLHIEALTDSTAIIAWDAEADVTWEYGVVVDTAAAFVPADADFTFVADTNVVVVDSLAENTDYLFFMRKVCGDDKSVILYQEFTTSQKPVAVPFFDDFESGNNWMLINGELENKWVYGTAVNNGGQYSLYISNDGGTTHAYTNNKAASVFATKAIEIAEDGNYTFSYDWLANGESTYDYIRVALVPASEQLSAGTSLPSGVSTTALPTDWIALDGGGKLNLVTAWENKSVTVPVSAGLYKIVILWRDDTSSGTNPPAAIDNFSVIQAICDAPTDLNASDLTTTSATLDWTSDAEAWQLVYSENADFVPAEATPIAVTTKPYILGNLLAETTYYYAVRTKCGDDFFSAWSAISSFSTPKECVTEYEAIYDTICPGETITFGDRVLSEAGTYVDSLTNIEGCDSIVTLNLSIYAAEDSIFVADTISENDLPYTYEAPYITDQLPIHFDLGTEPGVYTETALVHGEHCATVLSLTLTITKAQGIDNIFDLDGKKVQKVLYRDIMYIIVENEWYNAAGQKVNDPRK